jgi:hypothetical protein
MHLPRLKQSLIRYRDDLDGACKAGSGVAGGVTKNSRNGAGHPAVGFARSPIEDARRRIDPALLAPPVEAQKAFFAQGKMRISDGALHA